MTILRFTNLIYLIIFFFNLKPLTVIQQQNSSHSIIWKKKWNSLSQALLYIHKSVLFKSKQLFSQKIIPKVY